MTAPYLKDLGHNVFIEVSENIPLRSFIKALQSSPTYSYLGHVTMAVALTPSDHCCYISRTPATPRGLKKKLMSTLLAVKGNDVIKSGSKEWSRLVANGLVS